MKFSGLVAPWLDNFMRIGWELTEKSAKVILRGWCESDYNISLRPVGCYISIIRNINSPNATLSPNSGFMLSHRIRSRPIISCNFSSPSRRHVVYAEVHDIYYVFTQKGWCHYICRQWEGFPILCEEELPNNNWLIVPLITSFVQNKTNFIKCCIFLL